MIKNTAEIKILGDTYAGFYSCGLTMLGSDTMFRFEDRQETEDTNELRSKDGLVILAKTKKSPHSDAYELTTSFTNGSEADVTLEMMTSFLLPNIKADKIHRILSFWSAEGRVKTDVLADLNMEHAWNNNAYRVEKFGNVGSMPVRKYFPFIALEDSESGTFTAVQLYSPASWQIELVVRRGDVVTLAGGIADRDFGQWTKKILPGETFTAPKAVLATGNSLEEVCDELVKAQHPDISPVDDSMGIVFNEYCATWGNPTIDNLKKVADKIAGKGIQYLVMDSGWYSDCGDWWDYRGDWSINKKRFPNGLKELTDYIRSKGMIPGIWFEPEVASPKAAEFNETEHFVKKDGKPLTVGCVRFWDTEDPWVKDFLYNNVIKLLKDNNFGYVKIDYNDTMGVGCDGPDGPGENLRKKVLGTQEFLQRMKKEIPGLVIENCSSGGHRLEPSFMEIVSQSSFSDAHEIKSLPIIAANLHRVIRPEQSQIWAVLRAKDDDARLFYSMCGTFFGRMGMSGDIYDLSDHQWQLVDEGMAFYHEIAPIIKDGYTSRILCTARYYNEPKGCQLVERTLAGKTLFVFHRFADSCTFEDFAKEQGVDISKYKILKTYGKADRDFSACAILAE